MSDKSLKSLDCDPLLAWKSGIFLRSQDPGEAICCAGKCVPAAPRWIVSISLTWPCTRPTYVFCLSAGLLGMFVSWQYGACYSWVAQKIDVTGRVAPIFFIGCGVGGLIFPLLSGYIFTWDSWGPVGILHLTLIACAAQCCVFAAMWGLSRKSTTGSTT